MVAQAYQCGAALKSAGAPQRGGLRSGDRRMRPDRPARPADTDPRAKAGNEADRRRLRLWLRMLKSTRRIENVLRERLRLSFAATLPRFDVLAALERRPDGLKMSELSQMLMVSNGNVTGIVDRLEVEGLVLRLSVSGDRRATRVRLSEEGRLRFAEMAAEHAKWIEELTAGLNDDEVDQTASLLAKLAAAPPRRAVRLAKN